MRRAAPFLSSLPRFTIVTIAGLAVDLGTGWSLAAFTGVPLVAAAAIGFLAGALFNYVAHEFWTFRSPQSGLSARRAALYLVTMTAMLAVRLGAVSLLAPLGTGRFASLVVLIAAAGVSFVVNFLLSHFIIYRSSSGAR